jgi:hypothetical protein
MTDDGAEFTPRTFRCFECGSTAGTVRLATSWLGLCLEVSSFTSELKAPVSQLGETVADLVAAMDSAKALYNCDHEFAPFFCPICDRCYCGEHWRRWDVFDEDGWHDSIRGVCPQGHERMLEE